MLFKVLSYPNEYELTQELNKFVRTCKTVEKVQFSTCLCPPMNGYGETVYFSVLIQYTQQETEDDL